MDNNLSGGKRVLGNMIWRFGEKAGAQLVTFFVSIILARLLDPEAYGIVSLITVFLSIMIVFIDSGLGDALIQKKDADDIDFSTVFYTNIVFCLILYSVLFVLAPNIASFFSYEEMTSYIRVLGLSLIISSVKNVQQAYVSKYLLFKKFFFSTILGTIGAAIIGIIMALLNYGVWALIVSNLFNNLVDVLVLWITVKWRPQKVFSLKRLSTLFSFGSKILVACLINNLYTNAYELIIGKLYSASDIAYYNKGKSFPQLAGENIDNSIKSVLLPVFSEKQDDLASIKRMASKALKTNYYVMAPILLGLFITAEPLIKVLLTEKWMPSAIFLKIFCIVLLLRPFSTVNLNLSKSIGRSDIFLYMEIAEGITGIILLVAFSPLGTVAIAWSAAIHALIKVVINSYPSKGLCGYGIGEQIRDIIPNTVVVILTYAASLGITNLVSNDYLLILAQVILCISLYIIGSILFKLDSFYYCIALIKTRRGECSR